MSNEQGQPPGGPGYGPGQTVVGGGPPEYAEPMDVSPAGGGMAGPSKTIADPGAGYGGGGASPAPQYGAPPGYGASPQPYGMAPQYGGATPQHGAPQRKPAKSGTALVIVGLIGTLVIGGGLSAWYYQGYAAARDAAAAPIPTIDIPVEPAAVAGHPAEVPTSEPIPYVAPEQPAPAEPTAETPAPQATAAPQPTTTPRPTATTTPKPTATTTPRPTATATTKPKATSTATAPRRIPRPR